MTTLTETQIERGILRGFRERLSAANVKLLDAPGKNFRLKGAGDWIEVRLTGFTPNPRSRLPDEVQVRVRVATKTEAKGSTQLDLSALVDAVRAVMEQRTGAKPMNVFDENDAAVGNVQWLLVTSVREYNQTVQIRGDSIPGLDVAILTANGQTSSTPCPVPTP